MHNKPPAADLARLGRRGASFLYGRGSREAAVSLAGRGCRRLSPGCHAGSWPLGRNQAPGVRRSGFRRETRDPKHEIRNS